MRLCMHNTYQRFERDSTLFLYVVKVFSSDLIGTFYVSQQSNHATACAVPSATLSSLSLSVAQPRPGSLLLATLAAATGRLCRRLLCMSWASRPAHAHAAAPAPCPRLQALGFASRLSSGTEKKELFDFEKGRGERGHIHVREIRSFLRVSEQPKTGPAKISASGFAAPCGSLF